jgi:hypothetical protein
MATRSITERELEEIYAFAVQLGKDAGRLLLEAAQSRFSDDGDSSQDFSEKDSAVDIVTKTDEGEPRSDITPCFVQTADLIDRRGILHQDIHRQEISRPCVCRYPHVLPLAKQQ